MEANTPGPKWELKAVVNGVGQSSIPLYAAAFSLHPFAPLFRSSHPLTSHRVDRDSSSLPSPPLAFISGQPRSRRNTVFGLLPFPLLLPSRNTADQTFLSSPFGPDPSILPFAISRIA
ncbi:hypothetical protein K0M31_009052 [Melipona bicolor]|uniref:Uncharacterized protein n=1 Tax=Melipona bicolor TaxID=60889 RepID=A0AA40FNT9_9HYME|nr:hypothetical protein K0M31_009052 [Melipona bicolor]